MPKFLDVPYYYGQDGNLLNLDLGEQEVQLTDGDNSFNMGQFNMGRYHLKAPESITTLNLSFNMGTHLAKMSFTPTMSDTLNSISFEIIPALYTTEPMGIYNVTFKNVFVSQTNGSSNTWSTVMWGDCTFAFRAGSTVSMQYTRVNNLAMGNASFLITGTTVAVNESISKSLANSIYVPVTKGTAGTFLISTGGATPSWTDQYPLGIYMNDTEFGLDGVCYTIAPMGYHGTPMVKSGMELPLWGNWKENANTRWPFKLLIMEDNSLGGRAVYINSFSGGYITTNWASTSDTAWSYSYDL